MVGGRISGYITAKTILFVAGALCVCTGLTIAVYESNKTKNNNLTNSFSDGKGEPDRDNISDLLGSIIKKDEDINADQIEKPICE